MGVLLCLPWPCWPDRWNVSAFHETAETIQPFVFMQFRMENRFALFLELLYSAAGRNCSVSVVSFIAVVVDWPPVMASDTASN
jgi:hypothetical protein